MNTDRPSSFRPLRRDSAWEEPKHLADQNSNSNNMQGSSFNHRPSTNISNRSTLEQLEYSHMGVLEVTLKEMMSPSETRQSSMAKQSRDSIRSPTEWTAASETSNLKELREELERADSVYSRKASEEGEDDPSIVGGRFLPISPHFETNKKKQRPSDFSNESDRFQRLPVVVEPSPIKNKVPPSPELGNNNSKTKKEQGEETTEETTEEGSSNEIPHEVYFRQRDEEDDTQTQDTESMSYALMRPTTPAKYSERSHLVGRGWSSATETPRPPSRSPYTTPSLKRRNSERSLASSYLRSAQSPVSDLLMKQEAKRKHLKASINSIKSHQKSLDQTLQHTLMEKDQMSKNYEDERRAHQELLETMENKIQFLQQQHEHQQEQHMGVLKLTQTHNNFLKDQLKQLQKDYVKIQLEHKEELDEVLEKPKALYKQMEALKQSKALIESRYEQERRDQKRKLQSLETQIEQLQQEKSWLQENFQQQLQEERSKTQRLKQQVELESQQARSEREKVEGWKREESQSHHQQISSYQSRLEKEQEKYQALKEQHLQLQQERASEKTRFQQDIQELRQSLERSSQQHDLHNQEDQTASESLRRVQQERDDLLKNQEEQTALQETMKESFLQKVAVLERECNRLRSTLETQEEHQETQIETLEAQLKSSNCTKELQAENQRLRDELDAMKEEQERLLAQHKQELDETKDANSNVLQNLAKELGFGL
eukprot:scaffold23479_cov143-Cylindrotheca_fusiformis.AAC.28